MSKKTTEGKGGKTAEQMNLPFPHIKFAPSILKRLGEELNPNPDHGLLELVKNAYDADAKDCTIQIENSAKPGGTVTVEDNGIGMDLVDIEASWLVLGHSSKSYSKVTALGRTPVGNKGLGRLAALRLGQRVKLTSRPESSPGDEFILEIDWNKYDSATAVEEVPLEIKRKTRKKGVSPGTKIELMNLRDPLKRADIKRLARGVLLLADPFGLNPHGFQPALKAPEFNDLETLVSKRYFTDAEFHLLAQVSETGHASARVLDWKGQTVFEADHKTLFKEKQKRAYKCPASTLDLWAFILDAKTFSSRPTTKSEVQDWLKEFGGVHLYMQGFRVSPYGDPGNDWVELDLQRVRNPEVRPSTNTAIGRVTIDAPGESLIQKTDRSGLIENEAFADLKLFAKHALNWMAKERLREREKRRRKTRGLAEKNISKKKETMEEVVSSLPKRYRENVESAFSEYEKARQKQVNVWEKEVQLYRMLSTAGITEAVFAHESKKPVSTIENNARQIEKRGKDALQELYADTISRQVDRILRQATTLKSFSALTLSQIEYGKRRTSKIHIHDVIKNVIQSFTPFLDIRKVEPQLHFENANPYLRSSESALEAIFTNFLANSLKSFESAPPGKHKFRISTQLLSETTLGITVSDNGPGISGIGIDDIWLPGESSQTNGTGLGLAIVKDTVSDLGGTVDARAKGELGGAEFNVELPVLGS